MNAEMALIIGCFGCIGMLICFTIPVFDDPFHKEGKISVMTWFYRECYELLNGEV